MTATVDGQQFRLRFRHLPKEGGKRKLKGITGCSIEVLDANHGWLLVQTGTAECGRQESGYNKETGRQFSMLRALRGSSLEKPEKAALLTAYIRSGDRFMCMDLWNRGFKNLYEVLWSKSKV